MRLASNDHGRTKLGRVVKACAHPSKFLILLIIYGLIQADSRTLNAKPNERLAEFHNLLRRCMRVSIEVSINESDDILADRIYQLLGDKESPTSLYNLHFEVIVWPVEHEAYFQGVVTAGVANSSRYERLLVRNAEAGIVPLLYGRPEPGTGSQYAQPCPLGGSVAITAKKLFAGADRHCMVFYYQRQEPYQSISNAVLWRRTILFQAAKEECMSRQHRLFDPHCHETIDVTELAACIYTHYPVPGDHVKYARLRGIAVIPHAVVGRAQVMASPYGFLLLDSIAVPSLPLLTEGMYASLRLIAGFSNMRP